MLEWIVLIQTLMITCSMGRATDYLQNPNTHFYYHRQHENSQNQNSLDSVQQSTLPVAPPLSKRFGGFIAGFPGGNLTVGTPPVGYDTTEDESKFVSAEDYSNDPGGEIGPSPFGYPDPGFQTQTGVEAFLIPNKWYGLLPWGIEGILIVIAGIILFELFIAAIIAAIGGLLALKLSFPWIRVPEDETESESRASFGNPWGDPSIKFSANVINAIDKFNET